MVGESPAAACKLLTPLIILPNSNGANAAPNRAQSQSKPPARARSDIGSHRDCARAIQFLRYHAKKFNLDKTRIASMGGSAGAGTSLWLAFHDDLADPANPDPVLRESSRITAAAATGTQATYDLLRWKEFLGEAAAQAGNKDKARYHFTRLIELAGTGEARPELAKAREYLAMK